MRLMKCCPCSTRHQASITARQWVPATGLHHLHQHRPHPRPRAFVTFPTCPSMSPNSRYLHASSPSSTKTKTCEQAESCHGLFYKLVCVCKYIFLGLYSFITLCEKKNSVTTVYPPHVFFFSSLYQCRAFWLYRVKMLSVHPYVTWKLKVCL